MGTGAITHWKDGREVYDNVHCIYEFADGHVREHLGGIYDYLSQQGNKLTGQPVNKATSQQVDGSRSQRADTSAGGSADQQNAYEARKEQQKQRKKLERAVEEAEKKVTKLEAELKELEGWMATPSGAANTALYESYAQLKEQLSAAETAWEEAMMKLEEI